MPRYRVAPRSTKIRAIVGSADPPDAAIIRPTPLSDDIIVRLYTATGPPWVVKLPRALTSTNLIAVAADLTGATPYDDLLLPAAGTPIIVQPIGTAGPERAFYVVDASSLPADVTQIPAVTP